MKPLDARRSSGGRSCAPASATRTSTPTSSRKSRSTPRSCTDPRARRDRTTRSRCAAVETELADVPGLDPGRPRGAPPPQRPAAAGARGRAVAPALSLRPRPGPWGPAAGRAARLHGSRRPDARARHRRQHGHLQRRPLDAARAAAVSRTRPPRDAVGNGCRRRGRALHCRGAEFSGLVQRRARRSRTRPSGRICASTSRGAPTRSRCRGCGSRPRSSRCSAWRRSSAAPSRRKRTRRVTSVAVISDASVAPPIRRASGRHRPDDEAQRSAARDHRRHAAVVRVRAAGLRRLGADRLHGAGWGARCALVLRGRAPQAGRRVRDGRGPKCGRSAAVSRNSTEWNKGEGATITPMIDLGITQVRGTLYALARRRRHGPAHCVRERGEPAPRAGRREAPRVRHPCGARRGPRPARVADARGGPSARRARGDRRRRPRVGRHGRACRVAPREHSSRAVPRGSHRAAGSGRPGVHVRPRRGHRHPVQPGAHARRARPRGRGVEGLRGPRRHGALHRRCETRWSRSKSPSR